MKLANDMLVSAVSGSLKVIGKFLDDTDFAAIVDKVLNGVEGYFKEDTTADNVAETITAGIRAKLHVVDSNPDN